MVAKLLIALLAGSPATEASEQTAPTVPTVIEVVNDTNAVLPGAHVVIHWEPVDLRGPATNVGIPRDIVGKTDREGRFSADLPEGFYDVFVAWEIMSPYSSKDQSRARQARASSSCASARRCSSDNELARLRPPQSSVFRAAAPRQEQPGKPRRKSGGFRRGSLGHVEAELGWRHSGVIVRLDLIACRSRVSRWRWLR